MRAKLREIREELRQRMHQPVPEQGRWLAQVTRGYFAYHAVPTNFSALRAVHHHVTVFWLRTLQRRSQKDRTTWERIAKLAADYLPPPKTLHPWPHMRFAVMHPRWEPRAGIPLARFCAGGGR
jgi:RNA-directed DNA polymerase